MNKSNKSITDKGFTLMDNFRENINSYIGNMTLSELSERAGIPFSTLRGMLYENNSDCNLSNAVKLAKVFSISVDELFGANTMEERTTDCLNTCRELPENSRYLISWFIQHQKTLNNRKENHKSVSIMKPKYKNGHLVPSNDFFSIDIDDFSDNIKAKVFLGIQVNCEDFMPHYSPYDILLLANDRKPYETEKCVFLYYGKMMIGIRKEEENSVKYYGIRNRNAIINESDIDELMGYIVETTTV